MEKPDLSRRNFLRLSSLIPIGLLFPKPFMVNGRSTFGSKDSSPNIIILLLDSLSARHLSIYSYPRNTSPYLDNFSRHANVYHAHYSAGNFTTPGTASLLTGTYPWTHRAISYGGLIARDRVSHNIFSQIGTPYNRIAYSQNVWADFLLQQFASNIDKLISPSQYNLISPIVTGRFFKNDLSTAIRSLDDFLLTGLDISTGSYLSVLANFLLLSKQQHYRKKYMSSYPNGIPFTPRYNEYFLIESVFDGIASEIKSLSPPYIAYFHLYPPHSPYYCRKEFVGMFSDDWQQVAKPLHPLSESDSSNESLNEFRQQYDEFIANVDFEFGRLYTTLSEQGYLDNCYFIVTSDHGELFERGYWGHLTPLLFQDVIHIPLLISAPGQKERKDFYFPTSNVDLLPTLLNLASQPVPEWAEGQILPGFGGEEHRDRSIFSVVAKSSHPRMRFTEASFALIKGDYKLISYTGYPDQNPPDELYNLSVDPEELNDLSKSETSILASMKNELTATIAKSDYKRG